MLLLSSAEMRIFHQKSPMFVISGNKDKICILIQNLCDFFDDYWVFKGCLDKPGFDVSKIGCCRPS